MKKKILHLITGLELGGGAENMLLQLLPKMQSELDNRVCVIMGKGEMVGRLEEKGVQVYRLDLKSIFDLRVILRYRRVLREFQPDVQVNYLIHADIFGRIFGKIFGIKKIIPYIRNIHKSRKILMFLDRITLPLADFVLTNSETARKFYIEKMKVRADKIMCIPNCIDLSRFENLNVDRKEKLMSIGIPEDACIVGTVARLEKQKDIPTLIRAFKIARNEYPRLHLLIVFGSGSQKQKIIELIKNLGIEGATTLLEKRADNLELISVMDIFVLPSLNEGMANVLLEAMALKKHIITSDIEENVEIIQNNLHGINFKTKDHESLYSKLKIILENLNQHEKLSHNAYCKVRDKYSIDIILVKLSDFLKNI